MDLKVMAPRFVAGVTTGSLMYKYLLTTPMPWNKLVFQPIILVAGFCAATDDLVLAVMPVIYEGWEFIGEAIAVGAATAFAATLDGVTWKGALILSMTGYATGKVVGMFQERK